MAERKIRWTEQQRRAIKQRGSDVLVTASAGTGKTAVLSGRCVDIATDKTICPDVLSMLVLTFTEMAAEQMRSRIAEQLTAAFLESGDRHLRYQLMLLGGADISTIHSFCKRLITEYFYKLGLDPTFRVIDDDEQKLLKAEVLEQTIDWAWEQSNLRQGLEQLLRRRNLRTSDGFPAKIITLSDFLDGVVSRQNWYQRAIVLTEAINPITGELGSEQKRIIANKLQHILNQLCHAKKLYESQKPDGDWADKCEETFIKPVIQCAELLKSNDWDKCAEAIRNFDKPRVNKPKELPEPIAELIQKTVKKALDAFERLSEFAIVNPNYLDKLGGSVGLQTKILVELVKKFDQLYSRAKRAINCLDFADLEQYALRLLSDESSPEDKPLPSETALALRRRYKYIFVDEYQDINPVQEAILDLLSSDGNVFVVGDVKQSIYAFRGAEPGIFLQQLKAASAEPKKASGGLRVDLNANWRSSKGILDFVNKIFSRIMTEPFAKIDYDESAKLRPAAKDKPKEESTVQTKPIVEFHILDEQSKQVDESDSGDRSIVSSRQRQAAMIAQRIRQMVGAETGKAEFQIYDKQQAKRRDVQYRDIVILMRSPSMRVNDYVEILQLAAVPVSCESAGGYFEKTEIRDLLCLLKVLDNPQRDIELAAVLRSPFFKINDTELAEIKIHSAADEQPKNFHDCVLGYRDCGTDVKLAGKLKEALDTIEQWRTIARRGNLGDLIWQIYRATGYLSFVSALPNGQSRRANLLRLHERAIQFEGFASSSGNLSLRRFVEFIEKLQEMGQDWTSAEPQAQAGSSATGNAVRIISVHKSKGLEFPVVFLAELDSQFSKKDSQQDCLANVSGTLGLRIIDSESKTKLDSIAYQVIEEQRKEAYLEEEMRILYVATTRARERLILSACEKKNTCRDIICNGFFLGDETIADWQLRSCKSHLEWLLYGLCDQKNLHTVFETGLAKKCADDGLFSIELYGQDELERFSKYIDGLRVNKAAGFKPTTKIPKQKQPESELFGQVKKSLTWRYRLGDVPALPAKLSVTQLTHRDDEYVKFDYSRALERRPKAVLPAGSAGVIDARSIGTATHLVIARLDLAGPLNKEAIEKTKEKLLADGSIPAAVAEYINTESIKVFFESEIGQRILNSKNSVLREWPFTFAIPASQWQSDSLDGSLSVTNCGDETIIVQGIIDMLVQTPQGLLVIDFKTDHITAEQIQGRAESYRKQLELYSRAAGAILKAETIGKWLYFLTPSCAIEVV